MTMYYKKVLLGGCVLLACSFTALAQKPKGTTGKQVPDTLAAAAPIRTIPNATSDATLSSTPVNSYVSVPAKFPGGNQEINNFISTHLQYPREAVEQGLQGRVNVKFIISATGDVTEVRTTDNVSPLLKEAAIKVVKKMPKWEPATVDGKPVASVYTLPINFLLQ